MINTYARNLQKSSKKTCFRDSESSWIQCTLASDVNNAKRKKVENKKNNRILDFLKHKQINKTNFDPLKQ